MDSVTCPHHVAQHRVILVHVTDVLAALLEEGLLDLHEVIRGQHPADTDPM